MSVSTSTKRLPTFLKQCQEGGGTVTGLSVRMVVLSLSMLASVPAFSQSAEIFDDAPITDSVPDGSPPAKQAQAPGPVDLQPSRFAGQDIEPYTAARAAVFSMRNRATDPFGLMQDPNAKPVIRKMVASGPSKRQAALPPTPLADIVKLIRVTTLMPGEKKFLVGTRSFSQGDEFPIVYRGKPIPIKILEVSSTRILFINTATKEKATLEMGLLPPGMIAGGKNMTPPGMVAPTVDQALTLESDSSFEANN